jgi:hypothetical protein
MLFIVDSLAIEPLEIDTWPGILAAPGEPADQESGR